MASRTIRRNKEPLAFVESQALIPNGCGPLPPFAGWVEITRVLHGPREIENLLGG